MQEYALHFPLSDGCDETDIMEVLTPMTTCYAEGDSYEEWGETAGQGEVYHGMVYFKDIGPNYARETGAAFYARLAAAGVTEPNLPDTYAVTTADDWSVRA